MKSESETVDPIKSSRNDDYPVESFPIISMNVFGKDHWSTFAYIETRIKNYNGFVDHNHMRCDADRHPTFSAAKDVQLISISGIKYPTLVKGDFNELKETWDVLEIENHDDYDCISDLLEAGLLEVEVETNEFQTGLDLLQSANKARFSLTEKGKKISEQLIHWKEESGSFHSFFPEEPIF